VAALGRKRTLPHRKNRTAEKSFLHTIIHVPIWFMDEIEYEPESNLALATSLEDSFFETRRLRQDGFSRRHPLSARTIAAGTCTSEKPSRNNAVSSASERSL